MKLYFILSDVIIFHNKFHRKILAASLRVLNTKLTIHFDRHFKWAKSNV